MRRSEISFTSKSFRNSISAEDLAKRSDVANVGVNKGLRTSFSEDEVIFFPAKEEAQFRVGTFTDKNTNKKTPTIELWVYTDRQKWTLVQIAIFRRVPSKQEEINSFKEDNDFGCSLAAASISDLEMMDLLYGKSVRVSGIVEASIPQFEVSNGKYTLKRDAEGSVCYEKDAFTKCYKFEVVENE
jgi:hypothetical protein